MPKKTIRSFDPVCGMDTTEIVNGEYGTFAGEKIVFCGIHCKGRFKKSPKQFSGTPLIECKDVTKSFRMGDAETVVLRNLCLRIWEGAFTVIIGSSGSGKSTALNMIGLLDRPTSGKIFLRGKDISTLSDDDRALLRSETFGFVFQQYNLVPWLTAYENVILPTIFAGREVSKEYITKRFESIGLAHRMNHHPNELSGGERQRVALLRALSNDPSILIGDEPTGNLDSATGERILDLILDLNRREKKTLIVVTHDGGIAQRADQILALKDGVLIQNHVAHMKTYTE